MLQQQVFPSSLISDHPFFGSHRWSHQDELLSRPQSAPMTEILSSQSRVPWQTFNMNFHLSNKRFHQTLLALSLFVESTPDSLGLSIDGPLSSTSHLLKLWNCPIAGRPMIGSSIEGSISSHSDFVVANQHVLLLITPHYHPYRL